MKLTIAEKMEAIAKPDQARRPRLAGSLRPPRGGSETGASLVEVAIMIPFFFLLILGAIDLGRLGWVSIEVANAARAGTSYGFQNLITAADTTGMQTAATNDAPDLTGLTATASHFCKCSDGSASTCLSTDCSTSRMLVYVQVNTSATCSAWFSYSLFPTSWTVTGQSIMRAED